MKLGKLLAAGKSVMNGRKEVFYRSCKQVYLPKFGPSGNPFKSENEEPPAESQPKDAGRSSAAPRAAHVVVPEAPVAESSKPAMPVVSKSPVFSGVYEKKNAPWSSKLSAASILKVISPKARTASANSFASGQRPTQAELSLDSVKVVHNDLTDVDVEIVPIKSRSGPADLPPAKKSWEFLGERLFGVEAT